MRLRGIRVEQVFGGRMDVDLADEPVFARECDGPRSVFSGRVELEYLALGIETSRQWPGIVEFEVSRREIDLEGVGRLDLDRRLLGSDHGHGALRGRER